MSDKEILSDLKNKRFYKMVENIRKITAIEQFKLNEEWTDYLQERADFGNKHLLKGFQYRLFMENE